MVSLAPVYLPVVVPDLIPGIWSHIRLKRSKTVGDEEASDTISKHGGTTEFSTRVSYRAECSYPIPVSSRRKDNQHNMYLVETFKRGGMMTYWLIYCMKSEVSVNKRYIAIIRSECRHKAYHVAGSRTIGGNDAQVVYCKRSQGVNVDTRRIAITRSECRHKAYREADCRTVEGNDAQVAITRSECRHKAYHVARSRTIGGNDAQVAITRSECRHKAYHVARSRTIGGNDAQVVYCKRSQGVNVDTRRIGKQTAITRSECRHKAYHVARSRTIGGNDAQVVYCKRSQGVTVLREMTSQPIRGFCHNELKHKPCPVGLFIFSKVTLALWDELMDVSASSIVSQRH
ncbi:hypothetical protein J6590_009102 [Homalodisca vitripennis]|nr:hypothetical protein J6590_009102 [Homalodisca vitripennis]